MHQYLNAGAVWRGLESYVCMASAWRGPAVSPCNPDPNPNRNPKSNPTGANPQALNQSVAAGGPLQGVLFWLWDARSEGSDTRSSDQGITSSDSTWCGAPKGSNMPFSTVIPTVSRL